jgi:hypothetical protein
MLLILDGGIGLVCGGRNADCSTHAAPVPCASNVAHGIRGGWERGTGTGEAGEWVTRVSLTGAVEDDGTSNELGHEL